MRLKKYNFYFNNILWLTATLLLTPIFYCLIFLRRKNSEELKILVIPPVKIGDLVCSTPVFREIKKKFPESQLDVVLLADVNRKNTSYQLIKYNPYINNIILLEKNDVLGLIRKIGKKKYTWSIVLTRGTIERIIPFWSAIPNRVISVSQYENKSSKILRFSGNYKLKIKLHTLALRHYLDLLKFLGIDKFNEKKEIFVSQVEERIASQFLKKNNLNTDDLLIGIAIAAGNKLKEWPKEKFAQLADRLVQELQAKIIFIGGSNDKKDISFVQSLMKEKSIDSSQSFNLIESAVLLKYLKLFISVDTGPLYMANAMGTPVVDIAGPIDINEQPPLGDKCEIVQKDLPCVPCSFVIKTARFCKHKHLKCVKDISVDDVWQAGIKLIKNK